MKTVGIIQARAGGTRFPGKVFGFIDGRPMVEHVVEAAESSAELSSVVLAVPVRDVDKFMGFGVPVWGGDEADVLKRVYHAAKLYEADIVVRITADCPMLQPDFLDEQIKLWRPGCIVVAAACSEGIGGEVFDIDTLGMAATYAAGSDREHVTPWIRDNYEVVYAHHCAGVFNGRKNSVDTAEELSAVRSRLRYMTRNR